MTTQDPTIIGSLLVEFYEEILGNKTVNRCPAIGDLIRKWKVLTEEQQYALIQRFELQEVKKAMFKIDNTKSSGPEGYVSGFYKAVWSLVGEDVTNVVQ
ncbi:hypothetical protein KY285_012261 [Solanum tuberosum]|nr:hypothetical protein KY285_012261 [Solanum tuberosum]